MTHIVAVYGTLRMGQPNHRVLAGAKFLTSCTLPGWTMYHLGGFPAIVRDPDNYQPIAVELYEVDDEGLARCDMLEGYDPDTDTGMYLREQVSVLGLGFAYIYHMSHDNPGEDYDAPIIPTGNWCAQ